MPELTWSAELLSATKDGGNVVATVRFTGPGGVTLTETTRGDDLDDVALAKWAKARITSFMRRDTAFAQLVPGPITLPPDV